MVTRASLLWFGLLVGACASAPARRPAEDNPVVSLQVDALRDAALTPRTVSPGESVQPGDRIALTLWTDRTAQVYVIHYSPDGWSTLLWPTEAEQPLPPDVRLRVPAGGKRLTVAGAPGEEVLYVLATPAPILKVLPDACERFRLYCPTGEGLALQRGD